MIMTKKISNLACVSAAMLALVATSASAKDGPSDSWKWGADVYFWGASLGGKTTSGSNVDLPINKIIDNLKFGLMGTIVGRKGPWSVFSDMIYLDVGSSGTVNANVGGISLPVSAAIDLKGFISTTGVGYRVYEQSGTSLDATAGFRYLWLDGRVDVSIPSLPSVPAGEVKEVGSNWDAVVGLRGRTDLNDKWYLTYYGDVGAGNSDSTWQAFAAINYRLKSVDLTAGYRYLDFNLGKFGPFKDLNLSGPFAGVKIAF